MFLANKLAGSGSVAKTYVDDVFAITLYTGGVVSPVVNGIDLAGKGGLTIFKSRTTDINGIAGNTAVLDTIRGLFKLQLTDTSPQATFSGAVTSFNNDGFTLGSSASAVNYSGTPYVNYTFRKASKFFDVVSYTGDNQIRTISHSLGSTPGMMFLKRYSGASASWVIYHRSLTATSWTGVAYIGISTTASIWNNTEPTTTGFTIGNNQHNTTGESNIAYLFGHDTSSDGLIFCDQFTTDASGLANVTIGWEPQFLWAKEKNNSGADGGWIMLDIQRGWSLSDDAKISPSSTAAEVFGDHGNPTSDGFVFKGAASAGYIYMAIRRSNKPPTSGTEVFNLQTQASTVFGAVAGTIPDSVTGKVDLVMLANRGGESSNFTLSDRVRGFQNVPFTGNGANHTSPALATSSTSAETSTGGRVFQRNGVGGYLDSLWYENNSNISLVSYVFKRAAGFFDVVAWKGDGAVNRFIPHNLNAIPELVILKNRSSDTTDWCVAIRAANGSYYRGDDGAANGRLNNTGYLGGPYDLVGFDYIRNNSFFAQGIAAGSLQKGNGNGENFIAYLFATLPGISKVGSYTGNGTSQNIPCGFVTGARFVMIKRTDAVGDWLVFDTARGININSSWEDNKMTLNSTAAEVINTNGVYPHAAGFGVVQDVGTNTNIDAATYTFLAIA